MNGLRQKSTHTQRERTRCEFGAFVRYLVRCLVNPYFTTRRTWPVASLVSFTDRNCSTACCLEHDGWSTGMSATWTNKTPINKTAFSWRRLLTLVTYHTVSAKHKCALSMNVKQICGQRGRIVSFHVYKLEMNLSTLSTHQSAGRL